MSPNLILEINPLLEDKKGAKKGHVGLWLLVRSLLQRVSLKSNLISDERMSN